MENITIVLNLKEAPKAESLKHVHQAMTKFANKMLGHNFDSLELSVSNIRGKDGVSNPVLPSGSTSVVNGGEGGPDIGGEG